MQAKVLHLRNQLYRQTRIRTLNEKTCAATKDRAVRAESLVAEMRTDLKSLKTRLDEELTELGLDQDKAEAILKAYYQSQERNDQEVDEVESGASKKVRIQQMFIYRPPCQSLLRLGNLMLFFAPF